MTTVPYIDWVRYIISTLRPTYRGKPASERRREQWRRYGQSMKGLARYATYNASAKGGERVEKYRRSVHGMMTLERARRRNRILYFQAKLDALDAELSSS